MKVTSSVSLYPELAASVETSNLPTSTQAFRLHKIGKIEAFLRSEVESCTCMRKKYSRAVNTLDGMYAMLGTACVAAGVVAAS